MAHYIAVIHKEPNSSFGVSFPDVPGVIAVADTLDAALSEASIALGFAFEDWKGMLPVSRTLDALQRDKEFLDLAKGAIVAAVLRAPNLASAA
jgi:predicted RNase H-like HicB family nuclease